MTYIIGEIGQNHNGSIDIAKLLIDVASRNVSETDYGYDLRPMDAVKLTKRDLAKELTATEMSRIYDSPNSFGKTYGEHRAFLELNDEQHYELYKYSKSKGLDFVETLCSPSCLSLLSLFSPDKLKLASRDLTNIPLLEALSETNIPMIISTGMAGKRELDSALEVITRYHDYVSILHCVSQYPTVPDKANLNTIKYLKEHYPEFTIGYSDHTVGISAPVAAVAMGAQVIEKHITLDRNMKGTDQAGSLGIDGIYRMVRDIRLMEMFLGKEDIFCDSVTENAKLKLERSIATNRKMNKGEIVREEDIHLLSPGNGLKWSKLDVVLGKRLTVDLEADELIIKSTLEE